MVRWTPQELLYELRRDRDRKTLFVEGLRDLSFWRYMVPLIQRGNGAVYPIQALECTPGPGGERGRMLRSAPIFIGTEVTDRVRFFLDADCDRVLASQLPPNVILTDGRDLEGYGLNEVCLDHLVQLCFVSSPATGSELLKAIQALRPIGVLRDTDQSRSLKLPFRRTLDRDFNRFIIDDGGMVSIDAHKLTMVLVQNRDNGSVRELDEVLRMQEEQSARTAQFPDSQMVHGKDLLRFLGWKFGVTPAEMERYLFMSMAMETNAIRSQPNMAETVRWLTG